ncbi:hypothetical protein ACQY0O_005101 [Thecaphora frezii]
MSLTAPVEAEAGRDACLACLARLVPALLERIAALRAIHPRRTLLDPSLVFSHLAPLAAHDEVRSAFGLAPTPSHPAPSAHAHAQPEDRARLRNLCLEVASNNLRDLVYHVAKPVSLSHPTDADAAAPPHPSDDALRSTIDRLDAVLCLALHDLVDSALPLMLVEELLELNTVTTCSHLFGYVESRVKELTRDLHPTRGKGLVLLRLCNELLRRLSKPSQRHTVFAGRILSLLASVFPLGERSGVNLRGDFNVENRTILEDEETAAQDDAEGEPVTDEAADASAEDGEDKAAALRPDSQMYEMFWNMQRFFSNPPLLMGLPDNSRQSSRTATPAPPAAGGGGGDGDDQVASEEDPAPDGAKGPMAELRISTKKILALFAAVAKREKELAGAAAAESHKTGAAASNGNPTGVSRQSQVTGYRAGRDTANSAELVGDGGNGDASRKRKRYEPDLKDGVRNKVTRMATATEGEDADVDMQDRAAEDPSETDNFFPKYLTGRKLLEYEIRDPSFRRHILVQYLILFHYLLSFTPTAREKAKEWKNRNLQGHFVLDEADEQWVRKVWKEVLALLREIPPNGRVYFETVLEVLKRESNWIRWKTESCPSIEKPPLSPEQITAFANARALLLRPPTPYPHALGTAALSELWAEGFPPPVAGTRRMENEEGVYVDVATDGLEELEFLPPVPTLNHYHNMIKREEMKLNMRRRQIGIDVEAKSPSPEDREKEEKDANCQSIRETMQSLAWRALRVASSEHLHLFSKMEGPENVHALVKAIQDERDRPLKPVEVKTDEATKKDGEEPSAKQPEKPKEEEGDSGGGEATASAQPKAEAVVEDGEARPAEAKQEAATAVPVEVPDVPPSPAPAIPAAAKPEQTAQPSASDDVTSKVDTAAVEAELGIAADSGAEQPKPSEVTEATSKDIEMANATR